MDVKAEGTTYSRLGLVVALWITTLGLSVYGAKHIQDEIAKSEMLSQEAWLVDTVTRVMQVREMLGLATVETELGRAREVINDAYTVLAKPTVDVAPPPPPVAPPVVAGTRAHRRARSTRCYFSTRIWRPTLV